MAAPTVIKWTDSGAPTLSRAASSLIGVLDYCLLPRGWVKLFSGTDKAAYKASSGDRKCYRVLNDSSFYMNVSYPYTHAKITGYDSMTDVDTGVGLWADRYFFLHNVAASRNLPWICIVDESGFWLITFPYAVDTSLASAQSVTAVPHYVGDTITGLPDNTSRSVVVGTTLADCPSPVGGVRYPNVNVTTASRLIDCSRSLDGATLAVDVWLSSGGGIADATGETTCVAGFTTVPRVYDYPYKGNLMSSRPMLNDSAVGTLGDYLPGLYLPNHNGLSLTSLQEIDTFTAFIVISPGINGINSSRTSFPQYYGAVLVDTSEAFRV